MRVLLVSHRRPDPHGAGDAKIAYQALNAFLRAGHFVHQLSPAPGGRYKRLPAALWGALRGLPLQIGLTDDTEVAVAAEAFARGSDVDAVVAIHARAVLQVPAYLRRRTLALIVDAYGSSYSTYLEYMPQPRRTLYRFERDRMRVFESWIASTYGCVGVMSVADAEWLVNEGNSRQIVQHLPYAVDLDYFSAVKKRRLAVSPPTFVMTGRLNYLPNEDAAFQIIRRIAPAIRRLLPEAHFIVAGANPTVALRQAAFRGDVQIIANFRDAREILQGAAAALAPIRMGGGVQTKVLEAMAAGVPVVCSTFANRGIGAVPERDFLPADSVEAFAAAAVSLVGTPALALRLARAGRSFVERWHTMELFQSRLLTVVEGLAGMYDVNKTPFSMAP